VYERIPFSTREDASSRAHALETFCMGVLDAIGGIVPIVKVQSACFERYGAEGVESMINVFHAAHEAGLLTILDAKRGDIGISAEHYASFAFEAVGADSVTINAYLGPETMRPFLERADELCRRDGRGRGIFALVRTSNPDSDAIQSRRLIENRTVAEMVAAHVRAVGVDRLGSCGYSDVGAVVAATKPEDGATLRQAMPEQLFLCPGFGAQGGTSGSVRSLFAMDGGGAIVTASRSVIYAFHDDDPDHDGAIRTAAAAFAGEVSKAVGGLA
jgi:orotidine-5'-phosphate decarboxylase